MRKLVLLAVLLISFSAIATPLKDTLRKVEFDKNAKCFKTKETIRVCLTNRCIKNYDYLCVANSGEFDLRLRVNVYKDLNGNLVEDVTKVIFLNE